MQTIINNSLNIQFKYMAGTYVVGEISNNKNLAGNGESYILKINVTLSENKYTKRAKVFAHSKFIT